MNKKYLTILIHISGWIAFFIFPFVLLNFPGGELHDQSFRVPHHANERHGILPFFIINNFLFIVFFYLNLFYFLPSLYYQQKKVAYSAIIFVILLLAVYLPSIIKTELAQHVHDAGRPGPGRPFRSMDRLFGFFHFLIIWFLSSLIYLVQRYRDMEQRNKEMKVQKLDSELSYLKAQVNPHFLFNTLNNIYSLSICQSEQTPEAILKLSSIMRYVTQDAGAEKVPLEKELDYLTNYIDLQRLRSNNYLEIKYQVQGNIHGKMIAPLLLINFIENAFKHGVSSHVECFVDTNIHIVENQLILEVKNKKLEGLKKDSTATGTNNTRRRLELQYPGKHDITVDENNGAYKVILHLNLA